MICAINLPTWLSDVWSVYGNQITPILVTITVAILTYIAIKIRSDAKLVSAKTEIEIEQLKAMNEREDNTEEIKGQSKQIEKLTEALNGIADIINLVFQRSDLTPEVKEQLANMVNKVKFGSEDDLIKQQEELIVKLKEQLAVAENKANEVVEEVTDIVKVSRR